MFIGQVPTLSLDETSITASNVRINIEYCSSSNREGRGRGQILGRPSLLAFARWTEKSNKTLRQMVCRNVVYSAGRFIVALSQILR